MGKIVIFDLYDTLLKDISFDFKRGTAYLHETFFSDFCSLEELVAQSEELLPLYDQRKVENTEVCLIRDDVPRHFKRYGIPMPEDVYALDYELMRHMQQVTLTDEVADTLQALREQGIPMYVLSNSIFTGEANRRLLRSFGIGEYFGKLYSSADYGIRKPHPQFFETAVREVLEGNPGAKREDILYVGNDYQTDVTGGIRAGLRVVWYNAAGLPDKDGLGAAEIADFRDLLKFV